MRRSPSPVLPLLGAVLIVAAATLPAASHAAWVKADVNKDGVVKQVAQFAVLVYGLAHRKEITYVDVVSGETQAAVGGGTNYKLIVVAAKADGETAQYECLVWGVPGSRSDTWKLHRFKKIHS
ncbi:hypothetical protein PR202_gb18738 [Eleusine coracana subsp. coracana]|uniref:Cystatin domain-containing protein n=1 Tax=Eleusine coracana subsp. coracana TaxID=191504 RepID=A0AAV5F7S4_ELECO|nr:hypothetical protein QOZ80_3BG0292550 [Eleusine coracana subsp. coracana]GJN30430.1 hypothetical protein PR202_gb18738 [Eleusine coracana subsp. coracana]